ncbi:MAG: IreB family regulatory phosphoprotein [Eubacterium sp.]|nr:IreB family regulatory phosphoprotein [Eubacterium sp.]MEE3399996.1 IreB family regulatory phosphoprotein [Eubacterium sp.]
MDGYEGQHTQDINIEREFTIEVSDIIADVYEALSEKGYNPVNQIVGYIMSGDPTYITSYKGARSLIMKAERDEILELLMENYIDTRLKKRD